MVFGGASTMLVRRHRIESEQVRIEYTPTKKCGSASMTPRFIVLHYTATNDLSSSLSTLRDSSAQVSAHIVVGREGEVFQLVDFNRIAWHAGDSRWKEARHLNCCSIGIELVNAGYLDQDQNGFFGRDQAPKIEYDIKPSEVIVQKHKFESFERAWCKYPEEQLKVARVIVATLVDYYNIEAVLGHDDISLNGKVDPGPALPIRDFQPKPCIENDRRGLGLPTRAAKRWVNVRYEPSVSAKKVRPPLSPGERVEVIGMSNGWVYVKNVGGSAFEYEGWVSGKYLS